MQHYMFQFHQVQLREETLMTSLKNKLVSIPSGTIESYQSSDNKMYYHEFQFHQVQLRVNVMVITA